MPSSFDAQPTQVTHDPTQRIPFEFGKLPGIDPLVILDQLVEFVRDQLFKIIKDLTGIDLSTIADLMHSIFSPFGIDFPKFADLNPVNLLTKLVNALSGINLDAVGSVAQLIFETVRDSVQHLVDMIVNALTGGRNVGNPIELVQAMMARVGDMVSMAVQSANQAADLARQVMSLVSQVVQGLEDIPVFGDIFEAVNNFAFWVLGWFGITRQSVSDNNPAVAGVLGRITALESQGTPGLEGYADHFNRQVLGTDWANVSPFSPLEIVDGAYVKSWARRVSRFAAKTLVTDTWHVQASIAGLENGKASMFASCAPAAADGGFGGAISLELEHVTYPFNQGGVDYLRLYSINGGLGSGTLRRTATFDTGNIRNGDVLAIEYWLSENTFYVFKNNEEITALRWKDTGNVVQHGVGHRDVVLMTGIVDNGGYPGNGWDNLSVYDIKVA